MNIFRALRIEYEYLLILFKCCKIKIVFFSEKKFVSFLSCLHQRVETEIAMEQPEGGLHPEKVLGYLSSF